MPVYLTKFDTLTLEPFGESELTEHSDLNELFLFYDEPVMEKKNYHIYHDNGDGLLFSSFPWVGKPIVVGGQH